LNGVTKWQNRFIMKKKSRQVIAGHDLLDAVLGGDTQIKIINYVVKNYSS